MHILIVEDEENLRNSLKELLQFNKYRVTTAENGADALGLLAAGMSPDLIISDIIMPVMDGTEFIREVQAEDTMKHIPFIFLTARAELDEIRAGMGLGADDYIIKPVKYNDLIAAVELRIRKKQSLVDNITQKIRPAPNAERVAALKKQLALISDSELRVLRALSENKISKVVAGKLYLSIKTVQNHRANMAAKLGIKGQNSLLALAVECKSLGLI